MIRFLKRLLKWLGITVGGLVLLIVGLLTFVWLKPPKTAPASKEKVEPTPARLARGRYLFHDVSGCAFCHSEHEYERYGWPVKAGTVGGGSCFTERLKDLDGVFCPPNLTSDEATGLGTWSDGEIIRAIREGVDRDGKALDPGMPFGVFKFISDEDARSLVVYIRSLPIQRDKRFPKTRNPFPWSIPINLFPEPVPGPIPNPPTADRIASARYLATIARCGECHEGDAGPYSGGNPYPGPSGPERPGNLTPDPETGLRATREEFIGRFKSYLEMDDAIGPGMKNRMMMPWRELAGMTEADLGAIYDYLQTLPPIRNAVIKFDEPVAGNP